MQSWFLEERSQSTVAAGLPGDASGFGEFAEPLSRFTDHCKVYRQSLIKHPDWLRWLLDPAVYNRHFGPGTIENEWASGTAEESRIRKSPSSEPVDATVINDLCQFRRRLSMRIDFREINSIATADITLREQSYLADFCLDHTFDWSLARWQKRLGIPWDEVLDQPASFCVLGFGKLGGHELNLCSDVDLSFLYEGDGHCRKDGQRMAVANPEFYTRVCQEAVNVLQARTGDGFLYNVDLRLRLRLRPEGESGRLIRSLDAMEHYYFTHG